ncbi:MAG: glutaredoxin domain-containing protein [Bacteroidota bacterium]|nr:glutaredoxin domain-containing protein [Bacteroidota bacterium]
MIITEIKSHKDLTEKIGKKDLAYVLIYKKGSDLSECALKNINEAVKENKDPSASSGQSFELFSVNVAEVRDIHSEYSITSAPALLSFEKGKFRNTYKGCNDKVYYKSVFENLVFHAASGVEKPQKRVTVYSTPTCSWCTTIKNYLRTNGIRFKDVDVSKDQKAAEDMVRRSGQQGVPQTNINGQVVVGFDKEKINRLLGIEG